MASIQKDDNTGKWFCRVTYYDGKKRKLKTKKGFATQKEAKVYATELEYELNQGREISKLENCFADDFEDWCNRKKLGKFSPSTETKYKAEIKRVHEYFGKTKWKNLTRSMYQDYLDKRGKGKGKDVVEKTHNKLKGCIHEAIADGVIKKDPTYGAELNYDKESSSKIKVWSLDGKCQAILGNPSIQCLPTISSVFLAKCFRYLSDKGGDCPKAHYFSCLNA